MDFAFLTKVNSLYGVAEPSNNDFHLNFFVFLNLGELSFFKILENCRFSKIWRIVAWRIIVWRIVVLEKKLGELSFGELSFGELTRHDGKK